MTNVMGRTITTLAAIALTGAICMSDARADAADVDKGREVFATIAGIGCKTCHGDYAEGDLGVGPYIRGAGEGAIRAAIAATNEMVVVRTVITEEQIVAVAAYLEHLGTLQVARTLAKRGRFLPENMSTSPGSRLQLVIKNSGVEPATFNSDNMGIEPWLIAGRTTADLEWLAPEEEGDYSIYCSDCKLKGQFFVITVDASAATQAASNQD